VVGGCGRPGASRGVISFSLRSLLTEPSSVIDVAYWPIATFPCAAKCGRFRGIADMAALVAGWTLVANDPLADRLASNHLGHQTLDAFIDPFHAFSLSRTRVRLQIVIAS